MPYQPQRPNELNGFAPHYAPTMPGGAPMPNGLKMMNVAGSASQHAFAPPPMFGAQQAPMPPPFDHGPPHDLGPPHRRGHQQQLDGFNGRFMQPQQQADGGLPQSPMQFMPPSSMRPPMQMNNNGGGNFGMTLLLLLLFQYIDNLQTLVSSKRPLHIKHPHRLAAAGRIQTPSAASMSVGQVSRIGATTRSDRVGLQVVSAFVQALL